MEQSDKPVTPQELPNSNSRRNEIVNCTKCGLQLPRKKLKKHKKTHKAEIEIVILDRATKKSNQIRACQNCGEQHTATWLFERTTKGPLHLCIGCKTKILKTSFSHESIERRRISSLKTALKELKAKQAKLPPGTIDAKLAGSIIDIKKSIERGPKAKKSWSPIISGSFENGKRR